LIIAKDSIHYTGSAVISDNPAIFSGILVGTDSTNDPVVGVASNDGTRLILPTATYDASALGLNGYTGGWRHCEDGISITITCAGTVYVVPIWKEWFGNPARVY